MARLPLTLDDWGKKRVNNLTVTPPIILFFGIVRDKINTHKRKCGGGGYNYNPYPITTKYEGNHGMCWKIFI